MRPQKRLYREVLGIYMAAEDYSSLIDACIRLGDAAQGGDPQMWTEVLAYFADRPGGKCTEQLKVGAPAVNASFCYLIFSSFDSNRPHLLRLKSVR